MYLKGVSDEHVAAIERLQPYNGCEWTRLLRTISKPDKHRHLMLTGSPVVVTPQPTSKEAFRSGDAVSMKPDITVPITFGGGLLVVETFQEIQVHVAKTLAAFKPDLSDGPPELPPSLSI